MEALVYWPVVAASAQPRRPEEQTATGVRSIVVHNEDSSNILDDHQAVSIEDCVNSLLLIRHSALRLIQEFTPKPFCIECLLFVSYRRP